MSWPMYDPDEDLMSCTSLSDMSVSVTNPEKKTILAVNGHKVEPPSPTPSVKSFRSQGTSMFQMNFEQLLSGFSHR
jgi:hypothetical protein